MQPTADPSMTIAFARRQFGDALGLWILPVAAAWAGPALSERLIERAASRGWLHRLPDDRAASALARAFPECWQDLLRDWRRAVLVEASDAHALMTGRIPRLEVTGRWPQERFLPLGLHFGSGLLALWHLGRSGLTPRFVYRDVAAGSIPGRPVMHRYYAARARLVRRLCDGRPIRTGQAWQKLARALRDGDGYPVWLADTPGEPGPERVEIRIGACRLPLRAGGLQAAVNAGTPVVPFRVEVQPGGRARRLVIESPLEASDRSAIYGWIQRVLDEQPGQWLLWHAVDDFLLDADGSGRNR